MPVHTCPAPRPGATVVRPVPPVARVFRRFGPDYLRRHVVSPEQGHALRHIIACRTAALGGHVDECDSCGASWRSFNSCRDRHCPICQGAQQLRWVERRAERLVPAHHFHVVFTVPSELHAISLANRKFVYDLLFQAASDTLLELAGTHWDAIPGITAVLHTWSRQIAYHPHLHCIVTGGGLADDGGWVAAKPNFLFPVKVLSALFRGKFMHHLVRAYEAGKLTFVGSSAHLADPDTFAQLRRTLYDHPWVVYAKRPFGGPRQVLAYLGMYTHRVAISSSRIVSIDDSAIVFKTRDGKTCTLAPDEFIRRFLLHILPKGLRKIRHYGLLAPSNVATRLAIAQDLVAGMNRQGRRAAMGAGRAQAQPATGSPLCPACGRGRLRRREIQPARASP